MASLVVALAGAAARPAAADTVFKIATLAPEGSSWMKLYREFGNNVEKRTAGRVKFRFFAGGVQGDERDAVRKMRLGQINGAGVTGVGLGLIDPEVRALELPFLVKNVEELDHLRDALAEDFKKKFAAKGYVLLGWGDVGPIHMFTNVPIRTREDLGKVKIWVWVDDPLVRSMFKRLGMQGVSLGVPDVLPALQTGLIDACYGSPLSTVALQWQTRVKYMTSQPSSIAIGGTVVQKKDFDALSPEDQKALMEESLAHQTKARIVVRKNDNERALTKMKQLGIQVIEPTPALADELHQAGLGVWQELTGKMYSKEWLDRIEKILADYRKSHS
jgi:TRAP-type C4-dicarboxylate transport system substrate-binding protein